MYSKARENKTEWKKSACPTESEGSMHRLSGLEHWLFMYALAGVIGLVFMVQDRATR